MTGPIPVSTMQGIPVANGQVNEALFMSLTRRKREPEASRVFAGLGNVDNVSVRKSDILSRIRIRFSGSLTVVNGAGTTTTTAAWPHNLLKNAKVHANGQSNLHDVSGLWLKFREFASNPDLTDRGIVRTVGAASINQGTLSKASENWGVASSGTVANGTYPVELDWLISVAEDDKDLSGAIFCQTSSMDIVSQLQWANNGDLFITAGGATATLTGNIIVEVEKFSIPVANGMMILPDLGLFHSIIQTTATGISNGKVETRLIGQGAGKTLLRLGYRVLSGAGAAAAPLAVNAANYGQQQWVYGTAENPETYQDGQSMRMQNELDYGQDVAGVFGIMCHDFINHNAFRDTVDMGQTAELRLACTIQNGVALVNPVLEYMQETVFAAGN